MNLRVWSLSLALACKGGKTDPDGTPDPTPPGPTTDPTDPTDPTPPGAEVDCADGADDDGDGDVDTQDLDCLAPGQLLRATLLEGVLGGRLQAATPPAEGGLAVLVGGGLRVDGREELAGSVSTAVAFLDDRGALLDLHEVDYDFSQHDFFSVTPDGAGGAVGLLYNRDRTVWDGAPIATVADGIYLLEIAADGAPQVTDPDPAFSLAGLSAADGDGARCVLAWHTAALVSDGVTYPVGAAGGWLVGLLQDGRIAFTGGFPTDAASAWSVVRLDDGACAIAGTFTGTVNLGRDRFEDAGGGEDGLVAVLDDGGAWRGATQLEPLATFELRGLYPTPGGFGITGLGAVTYGRDEVGTGWMLEFDGDGAARREVAFVGVTYHAPTAVLADGDVRYLATEVADDVTVWVDGAAGDPVPASDTHVLLRLDPDGSLGWTSELRQESGSGLEVERLALEAGTLWASGQIYGAGVDVLDAGGPNERRVEPNGGAGFLGLWAR